MLDLELIAKIMAAHEELVIAVEDFTNGCLSEGYAKRLREALGNSHRLIAQAQ